VSSSDSNAREDLWARHYRAASERRRARGWHRRDEARPRVGRGARASRRARLYVGVAILFVVLTAVALVMPR
jgi:hypothetical protein